MTIIKVKPTIVTRLNLPGLVVKFLLFLAIKEAIIYYCIIMTMIIPILTILIIMMTKVKTIMTRLQFAWFGGIDLGVSVCQRPLSCQPHNNHNMLMLTILIILMTILMPIMAKLQIAWFGGVDSSVSGCKRPLSVPAS